MPSNRLRGATAALPLEVSYLTGAVQNTTASSFTFNSVDFGVADSARRIYVVTLSYGSNLNRSTTMTIGGVSATRLTRNETTALSGRGIFAADVPTGTSGTIVADWSANVDQCSIAVYRVVNQQRALASAVFSQDTQSDPISGVTSQSITLTGPSDGFALFSATQTTARSTTETNWTEDFPGTSQRYHMGSDFTLSGTSTTYTVSWTTNSTAIFHGATFYR